MAFRQHDAEDDTRYDRIHRDFLVEHELAERWRKSTRTLQRMRRECAGPAFHRIGGSILYRLADIEAFEATVRVPGDGE